MGVGDLFEGADLERDLVHQHAVLVVRLANALGRRGVNGGERMVIGPMRGEHRNRLAVALDGVGVAEAEDVHVEVTSHFEIGLPEREMAEPARLKRARHQDAADIVHAGLGIHGVTSPDWSVRAADP